MWSQRAQAACDGGSIYDDRSAFQDVERTARYEGTRLSGKMPSARRLRRKAVRCSYARRVRDSGCGGESVLSWSRDRSNKDHWLYNPARGRARRTGLDRDQHEPNANRRRNLYSHGKSERGNLRYGPAQFSEYGTK